MIFERLKHGFRCYRWRKSLTGTPMSVVLDMPFISPAKKFSEADLLVVDCEMSGLDPKQEKLLSIGWVEIKNGVIRLNTAKHIVLHSERKVGQSVMIHGIHNRKIARGVSIGQALSLFAQVSIGKVLVFHHATLDMAFINKAYREYFGLPLPMFVLDTMTIEQKRKSLQGGVNPGFRLMQCRKRYNLSSTTQHDALADAIATAELLLAQHAHIGQGKELRLSDLSLAYY